MDRFFARGRVNIQQTVDNLFSLDGLRDNLGNVFRLYLEIAYLLRINNQDGSSLAKSGTPGSFGIYLIFQSLFFKLRFKGGDDLTGAGGKTAGAGAY